MHTWIEQFKVALGKAKTNRDRLLVAMAFAFPNRTLDDLANLRVEDIKPGSDLALKVVLRLMPKTGLAFTSRKGRGSAPASRVTLWRILKATFGSGITAIRRIVGGAVKTVPVSVSVSVSVPVPVRVTPPQPLGFTPRPSLSDYYKKPGG